MPFDVIVGPLQCPNCGAEDVAEIQTRIRGGSADGSGLDIGFEFDAVDLKTERLLGRGYALVRAPAVGEPIRLLDVWSCWTCETEQWAVVEIANRTLRSVEAVTLDQATLDSANFISEVNAFVLAEYLRGDRLASRDDAVAELRRLLPQARDGSSAMDTDAR